MKIVVTGGAGYLGSITTELLLQSGHEVIIYDNLSSSAADRLNPKARFVMGDVRSKELFYRLIKDTKPDAVMHFAALTSVPDSLAHPLSYFDVNTTGTQRILEAFADHKNAGQKIPHFIFSSTAAVYGHQEKVLVSEDAPKNPSNPYGESKLYAERIIQRASESLGFQNVILRYFNVAGASDSLKYGPSAKKLSALVQAVAQVASGKRKSLDVFGQSFKTKDGTGERDYIHALDIAQAHVDSLKYLEAGGKSDTFNVGYGHGFTVLEVVKTMKKVTGQDVAYEILSAREGDIDKIYADSQKIIQKMQWTPKYDNLELICKSAYDWEMSQT